MPTVQDLERQIAILDLEISLARKRQELSDIAATSNPNRLDRQRLEDLQDALTSALEKEIKRVGSPLQLTESGMKRILAAAALCVVGVANANETWIVEYVGLTTTYDPQQCFCADETSAWTPYKQDYFSGQVRGSATMVPEPSTYALMLLGLSGMLIARRRHVMAESQAGRQ